MNGQVCLVPSKGGQCTLLAGHTGLPHRSPSGFEWEEESYIKKPVVDAPVKRGVGRPRKWFKDAQGKWYKNE